MAKTKFVVLCFALGVISCEAQTADNNGAFSIALPSHQGQLRWRADGFKVVQTSAKADGAEIGLRGADGSGRLTFLGFVFLFPDQVPMTSTKCRDGVMEPTKKANLALKVVATFEHTVSGGPPVELVTYEQQGRDGKTSYSVRGFTAKDDICGDLEIYSSARIGADDPTIKEIFESYRLDPNYAPLFSDALLYAQILYDHHAYAQAAPLFEQALTLLRDDKSKDQLMWTRIVTDQAGMAYGISGNVTKARALFESAIAKDPDYPLYYYNLACADAEENKLADARAHLQQAFARKANVVRGESLPDPTKDDSFLPYRTNKEFWTFVESLH